MAVSEGKFLSVIFVVAMSGGVLGAAALRYAVPAKTVTAKPQQLNITTAELIGSDYDKNKPVLVEFMDYECPPCKILSKEKLPKLVKDKNVTLVTKNYPLFFHKHALKAAILAEFSKKQGKYGSVHGILLGSDALSDGLIESTAKDIGFSKKENESERREAEKRVLADKKLAEKLKLPGTPFFILCKPDGTVWAVPQVFEQIDTVLNEGQK